jgi:phosphatidylserine/phosphatidylglycerophosphate/cardiolipin synthase-like enzyme
MPSPERHRARSLARQGRWAYPQDGAPSYAAVLLAVVLALTGCGNLDGDGGGVEGPVASVSPDPGGDPDPTGDDQVGNEPLPPAEVPTPTPAISPSPGASPEPATDLRRLCYSPREDCVRVLLGYLQSETEAIDMAIYHLYDRRITDLLVAKQRAGVRVRVVGDRHAYTSKAPQQRELNYLASNGVAVQINRHRGLMHHKMTIMHGLGLLQHGSMTYTAAASRKVFNGSTGRLEWLDEAAFFTTNARAVARFKERFERMWQNSGPGQQTFQPFTAGMTLPTFWDTEQPPHPVTIYEAPNPDPKPLPDDPALTACFSPDQNCLREVIAPIIRAETGHIDVAIFRVTTDDFATPLLEKVRAGLPVRIIFESTQYDHTFYPSMTRIINQLYEAGQARGNVRLKTTRPGNVMHMKAIFTPRVATWSSGNFFKSSSRRVRGTNTAFYQDDDTIITRDPGLVAVAQQRFDEMWNGPDLDDFTPTPPPPPSPSP